MTDVAQEVNKAGRESEALPEAARGSGYLPELTAQAWEAANKAATLAPWPVTQAWQLFSHNLPAFFDAVNEKPQSQLLYLFYYLRFLDFALQSYRKQGISMEIFQNTFSDIGRWEKACFQHTGAHGLEEHEWLSLHLRLKLFALGRLQFAPIPCPWDLKAPEPMEKGAPVLNVHIPSGPKLSLSQCRDSYRQAGEFFHMKSPVFVCRSWLLCPDLPYLLPPGSNILSFQEEYIILGADRTSRQGEERIFGSVMEDPSQYPENNSLQKNAKVWLMKGNVISEGYGVRRMPSKQ